MITEKPLTPAKSRSRLAQILFEETAVQALYLGQQPVLALFSLGKTTGLVLDSGHEVTSAVPVYEGFVCEHEIQKADYGGRTFTDFFYTLLKRGVAVRTLFKFVII